MMTTRRDGRSWGFDAERRGAARKSPSAVVMMVITTMLKLATAATRRAADKAITTTLLSLSIFDPLTYFPARGAVERKEHVALRAACSPRRLVAGDGDNEDGR
mmetsp:Transcript_28587/g.45942  ORF Transcript_28587/g.45942 Transcript_28587/m.45942 type:complete len:103 (-) Transcript_28587:11-319(-)